MSFHEPTENPEQAPWILYPPAESFRFLIVTGVFIILGVSQSIVR